MSGETPQPAGGDLAAAARPRTRPAHLSPGNIALVAVGGAIGTGLRVGIALVWPASLGAATAILLINILGAFVLGLILELLAVRGGDVGWGRRIRLGVGTGVLGGFTTYSTLAVDTVTLSLAHPALGAAYGLGTVVGGGLASFAGIGLAGVALARTSIRRTARTGGGAPR